MTTELQNKAWSILPKEFKEEVKELYAKFYNEKPHSDCSYGYLGLLIKLFGIHNLTSDAEGEEMLTVSRKKVQEMYAHYDKICNSPQRPKDYIESVYEYADGVTIALDDLFGSKCLPDEEPPLKITAAEDCIAMAKEEMGIKDESKPAEPKEEVAKMKPIESKVSVYLATREEDEEFRLLLYKNGFTWKSGISLISDSCWSSGLECDKIHYVYPNKIVAYCGEKTSETLTFSEFKKRYFLENVNRRQYIVNCDKQFDSILKDSFSKERRLNIATLAMRGILSNPKLIEMGIYLGSDADRIARFALAHADALMAEAEKGGKDGN